MIAVRIPKKFPHPPVWLIRSVVLGSLGIALNIGLYHTLRDVGVDDLLANILSGVTQIIYIIKYHRDDRFVRLVEQANEREGK